MNRQKTLLQSRALRGIGAAALLAVAAAQVPAHAADTSTQTRYPIVLVHGLLGFDSILGVDYFYRVPAELRASGAKVYVAEVSQINGSAQRGEQLLQQLKQWAAKDGVSKFNLIGHSQGGPTVRYVSNLVPEMVASVTTVGGAHTITFAGQEETIKNAVANYGKVVEWLGSAVAWASGSSLPQSAQALADFGLGVDAFNAQFPDGRPTTPCGQGPELVRGVRYFAVTGNAPKTNVFDLTDLLMSKGTEPTDGMVPVCAAHWGNTLKDNYQWNHLDEVNQAFGLLALGAANPVAFYRQQANRLKSLGL